MTFVPDSILVSLTLEHRGIQTHSFLISQFFGLSAFMCSFYLQVWLCLLEVCGSLRKCWRCVKVLKVGGGYEEVWGAV